MTFRFATLIHANISSGVNDQKHASCVSFTLGNATYFIFGVSDANIGDRLRDIILGGGWGFCFWVMIVVLVYPPLEVGWYYLEMVVLDELLCVFIFTW